MIEIDIIQGNDKNLKDADINIVIDVIRAFTTSFVAFSNGAKEIMLVNEVEKAFELKRENPNYVLAGEIKALRIDGFDTDNSPYNMSKMDLENRTLIQKTTNGVKATLNSLNANRVFVTGFSNAKTLANYIKSLRDIDTINIIASHPDGDDDLAVAEYLKCKILNQEIDTDSTIKRILESKASEKFFDIENRDFSEVDITNFCIKEVDSNFIMEVDKNSLIPTIRKVYI